MNELRHLLSLNLITGIESGRYDWALFRSIIKNFFNFFVKNLDIKTICHIDNRKRLIKTKQIVKNNKTENKNRK